MLPPMSSHKRRDAHTIRIIAGAFRGRRIEVPDLPGLRPSSDRVRETLFNWLQAYLPGSRCLDLFAGTGALGIEAASRGASEVIAVERDRYLAGRLDELINKWHISQLRCIHGDALIWLQEKPRPFDIVFLDPPFDSELLPGVMQSLINQSWLNTNTLIYIEYPAGRSIDPPPGFEVFRSARAGQVKFALFRRSDG